MNFPGRRTLEATAETERMPVDAGWALAGLSAVVRAQPLNGAGAAAKL